VTITSLWSSLVRIYGEEYALNQAQPRYITFDNDILIFTITKQLKGQFTNYVADEIYETMFDLKTGLCKENDIKVFKDNLDSLRDVQVYDPGDASGYVNIIDVYLTALTLISNRKLHFKETDRCRKRLLLKAMPMAERVTKANVEVKRARMELQSFVGDVGQGNTTEELTKMYEDIKKGVTVLIDATENRKKIVQALRKMNDELEACHEKMLRVAKTHGPLEVDNVILEEQDSQDESQEIGFTQALQKMNDELEACYEKMLKAKTHGPLEVDNIILEERDS